MDGVSGILVHGSRMMSSDGIAKVVRRTVVGIAQLVDSSFPFHAAVIIGRVGVPPHPTLTFPQHVSRMTSSYNIEKVI